MPVDDPPGTRYTKVATGQRDLRRQAGALCPTGSLETWTRTLSPGFECLLDLAGATVETGGLQLTSPAYSTRCGRGRCRRMPPPCRAARSRGPGRCCRPSTSSWRSSRSARRGCCRPPGPRPACNPRAGRPARRWCATFAHRPSRARPTRAVRGTRLCSGSAGGADRVAAIAAALALRLRQGGTKCSAPRRANACCAARARERRCWADRPATPRRYRHHRPCGGDGGGGASTSPHLRPRRRSRQSHQSRCRRPRQNRGSLLSVVGCRLVVGVLALGLVAGSVGLGLVVAVPSPLPSAPASPRPMTTATASTAATARQLGASSDSSPSVAVDSSPSSAVASSAEVAGSASRTGGVGGASGGRNSGLALAAALADSMGTSVAAPPRRTVLSTRWPSTRRLSTRWRSRRAPRKIRRSGRRRAVRSRGRWSRTRCEPPEPSASRWSSTSRPRGTQQSCQGVDAHLVGSSVAGDDAFASIGDPLSVTYSPCNPGRVEDQRGHRGSAVCGCGSSRLPASTAWLVFRCAAAGPGNQSDVRARLVVKCCPRTSTPRRFSVDLSGGTPWEWACSRTQ